jgi:capsular polysaccharide biosynthesis protein
MKDGTTKTTKNVLQDILFILKKNILWMLIIVIVATAVGVSWAYVRKPKYIAKQEINYYVKENVANPSQSNEINTMNKYVLTMVEFCKTEKVLDLANAYYVMYKQSGQDLKTFLATEKVATKPSVQYRGEGSHYSAANVGTYFYEKDATNYEFFFEISYQEANLTAAQEKVQILALACYKEAQDLVPGITTYLEALGFDASNYTLDLSKTRIVILAVAIGVVLSIAFVFIKNMFDSTLKTKEDLEKITGASVFACIDDRDELNKPYGKAKKTGKGGKD